MTKDVEVNIGGGRLATFEETANTFVLVDEKGNELIGVLVGEETVFTAEANDIREGKVAATADGVTVGTKEIPAYHTTEGYVVILAGAEVKIPYIEDCEYTKLQGLVCLFNSSIADSVSTEKVCIDDKVYAVASIDALANVSVDSENKAISFGVTNENDTPCVLRYFTYKEVV